ncbi:YtxH domain-containing protein [Agromyces indicus]|uniref:YtxH domain-containing protein n=1 Tax=Agromyces indicus TaxID=758919 RepID=A0ABU1FGI8_9MICO|nr:YtxH domain-containing protein [Agromyces indicus]MDR5690859.1 YtxH domain-containing protein [Agromyces indicus]
MKGKFLFVVGLGVGYVLGTRAGRERYEQIRKAAEDVWNQPKVQEGVDTVKGFAMSRAGDVGDKVLDGAKKLVSQFTSTQGSTRSSAAKSASGSSTGSSGTASTGSGSSRSTSSGSSSKPSGNGTKGSSGSSSSNSSAKSAGSGSGSGSSSSS